ncbi:hypothetical protein GS688_00895 [Rhodococcus hoagii]|nr:hypothetical protein [Prescottella equi]
MTNNANPPTGNNSARKPRWLRPNIEDPVALRRRERVEVGYRRFRRTAIALFIAGVVAGLIAMLAAIKIWLDQQRTRRATGSLCNCSALLHSHCCSLHPPSQSGASRRMARRGPAISAPAVAQLSRGK